MAVRVLLLMSKAVQHQVLPSPVEVDFARAVEIVLADVELDMMAALCEYGVAIKYRKMFVVCKIPADILLGDTIQQKLYA
jgi:hypothetical protein